VTLTSNLLTLKLLRESHITHVTLQSVGFLGLSALQLGPGTRSADGRRRVQFIMGLRAGAGFFGRRQYARDIVARYYVVGEYSLHCHAPHV